jgi:hypothetical protein
MNRLYIIILFTLILSCSKDNDLSMDFKIIGVHDITIVRGETLEAPLQVFYLGGEKEQVTVSAINVPPGVSIDFDNPSGEPDFQLTATITADINLQPFDAVISIVVTSESDKKYIKDFTLKVTDPANQLPVITLAGGNILTWTLNDPYADPGFMAIDAEDGNITAQVTVQGTVDFNMAGSHKIRYYVTDSEGAVDSALRIVNVYNSLSYMQGLYNCTTVIQGGGSFSWIADIGTSPIHNNNFLLSKISDCYGNLGNPMLLEVITNGTSVSIPPQVIFGTNQSNPGHCETAYHAITGSGTLDYTFPYTFNIQYTDLYEDSTGLQHTFIKTDTYIKVP